MLRLAYTEAALSRGAQFNPLDKGGGEQSEPGDFPSPLVGEGGPKGLVRGHPPPIAV